MQPEKKPRYVCHRCAKVSDTCCRLGSGGKSYSGADCFPLSDKERMSIENALSKAKSKRLDAGSVLLLQSVAGAEDAPSGAAEWAVQEPNSPGFVKAMQNLFPKEKKRLAEVFQPEGSHLRLALTGDGSCVFLSEYGCTLPQQARPHFCRLFPFWVVSTVVQCFSDENCLAVQENGDNFISLLGAFDVSAAELRERYNTLRRDWGVD